MRPHRIGAAALAAAALGAPTGAAAQIFDSQQAVNLQTTTTLPAGDLLFEISHRFFPPVSDGGDALWGLDGPVINRLGLAYAATDRVMLGIQRSILDDYLELTAKAGLIQADDAALPFHLGIAGGVAWNMSPALVGAEDNELQAYVQVPIEARLGEPVALGVVPTWLHNPRIRDPESDDAFVLGVHGQVSLTDAVSLLGEWIVSEERPDQEYDTGTFGVQLRTRGHFFKLLVTNQVRMNPSQVLGGSEAPFEADELRIGFNITRRLSF